MFAQMARDKRSSRRVHKYRSPASEILPHLHGRGCAQDLLDCGTECKRQKQHVSQSLLCVRFVLVHVRMTKNIWTLDPVSRQLSVALACINVKRPVGQLFERTEQIDKCIRLRVINRSRVDDSVLPFDRGPRPPR
jgi:hypothetical protein